MAKHKRQHYVPASYLEAWCDPKTPTGQTPYVWRISKDGTQVHKKAPRKLFYETDMYTVFTPDGNRDLQLEYNLSRVEGDFTKLRTRKLIPRRELTSQEHLVLCMFAAAMYSRTKAYAKHQSGQWQKALDMAAKVQAALDSASPEDRQRMSAALSSPHSDEEISMSIDEVKEIVDHPVQSLLSENVMQLSPLLYERPFLILETTDKVGFITSDNPCVWFDPAEYQRPRPRFAGGLFSPTLEITLPLSPRRMLFWGNSLLVSGLYTKIEIDMVNIFNSRTRFFSDEFIVSNSEIINPAWL